MEESHLEGQITGDADAINGAVHLRQPLLCAGRTQAVIPDSIMSILVPPRESTAAPIDKTASFQQTRHRLNSFGGNN